MTDIEKIAKAVEPITPRQFRLMMIRDVVTVLLCALVALWLEPHGSGWALFGATMNGAAVGYMVRKYTSAKLRALLRMP